MSYGIETKRTFESFFRCACGHQWCVETDSDRCRETSGCAVCNATTRDKGAVYRPYRVKVTFTSIVDMESPVTITHAGAGYAAYSAIFKPTHDQHDWPIG